MTDGSKAVVKRAFISVLVIVLSLTILRAFLNWIIFAVIVYAAVQLFNRKRAFYKGVKTYWSTLPGAPDWQTLFLQNCGEPNLQFLLVPARLEASLDALDTSKECPQYLLLARLLELAHDDGDRQREPGDMTHRQSRARGVSEGVRAYGIFLAHVHAMPASMPRLYNFKFFYRATAHLRSPSRPLCMLPRPQATPVSLISSSRSSPPTLFTRWPFRNSM